MESRTLTDRQQQELEELLKEQSFDEISDFIEKNGIEKFITLIFHSFKKFQGRDILWENSLLQFAKFLHSVWGSSRENDLIVKQRIMRTFWCFQKEVQKSNFDFTKIQNLFLYLEYQNFLTHQEISWNHLPELTEKEIQKLILQIEKIPENPFPLDKIQHQAKEYIKELTKVNHFNFIKEVIQQIKALLSILKKEKQDVNPQIKKVFKFFLKEESKPQSFPSPLNQITLQFLLKKYVPSSSGSFFEEQELLDKEQKSSDKEQNANQDTFNKEIFLPENKILLSMEDRPYQTSPTNLEKNTPPSNGRKNMPPSNGGKNTIPNGLKTTIEYNNSNQDDLLSNQNKTVEEEFSISLLLPEGEKEIVISPFLKNTLYQGDSESEPIKLPSWALAYIKIGQALAMYPKNSNKSLIMALAVPIRSYAAIFVSLGYEVAIARKFFSSPNRCKEHFEMIASLSQGDHLFYFGERWKPCILLGKEQVEGTPLLKVEFLGKNSLKQTVRPEDSWKLKIASDQKKELSGNETGHQVFNYKEVKKFYLALARDWDLEIDEKLVDQYILSDQHKNFIVGSRNLIEKELQVSLKFERGVALDIKSIVRVKEFLSEFDSFHFQTLSDRKEDEEACNPELMIFDGILAYSKYYDNNSKYSKLIILDQSNTSFAQIEKEIISNYREEEIHEIIKCDALPQGIELIAYQYEEWENPW